MAYKTVSPKNNEIAVIHMAQNRPQRLIDLGQWEFVCFVNHTQNTEKKIFGGLYETNCDIMFLVRKNTDMRLMSFKSNPWLKPDDEGDSDQYIFKQDLFLFSGSVPYEGKELSSDKIQSA